MPWLLEVLIGHLRSVGSFSLGEIYLDSPLAVEACAPPWCLSLALPAAFKLTSATP